jgi:hypothetical protein
VFVFKLGYAVFVFRLGHCVFLRLEHYVFVFGLVYSMCSLILRYHVFVFGNEYSVLVFGPL